MSDGGITAQRRAALSGRSAVVLGNFRKINYAVSLLSGALQKTDN
jgi:hypothetical protein